jgi:class 3 adenylate cyclase
MFDETLVKDLVEMYGKSLSFSEVQAVGGYLFKDRSYSIHAIAGMDPKRSISPLNAAKILVDDVEGKDRLKDLFAFTFELDGSPLNSKLVKLDGLENLLYRLTRSGQYYDFERRRFVDTDDHTTLINWGALRDGKDYAFTIVSIDICQNSELVKKHTTKVMEKVYYRLWAFLKAKLDHWEGRIWSWAGDGGILAFRGEKSAQQAVSCCLEILGTLAVFNMQPEKSIRDEICLRIGMDYGMVKFFNDTGRIVSDVINYAAHLEKKGTKPQAMSVSESVHARLSPSMQQVFPHEAKFEDRRAMATA